MGLITTIFMQNTNKCWMRQGTEEAARIAAKDLMGVTFSAYTVKEIEQQHIQQGDKFFITERMKYYTPQEQEALWVKWLMNLNVGEAFVKVGTDVRFIQTPLDEPQTTNEEIEAWRKQQPWLTTVNVTKQSFEWSTTQQSSSDTSSNSDSSSPTRRRIDDLFD